MVLDEHQTNLPHETKFITNGDDTAGPQVFDVDMPSKGTPRVLVMLAPRVLQDALAQVLDLIGLDLVQTEMDVAATYDVALVSEPGPPVVGARVTVTLPVGDDAQPAGIASVARSGRSSHAVVVRDLFDVVALLDRLCPAAKSRRNTLDRLAGSSG